MGQVCAWCPTGASLMRDCVREREGQGKREGQRAGRKACFFPAGMLELFLSEALGKKKKDQDRPVAFACFPGPCAG